MPILDDPVNTMFIVIPVFNEEATLEVCLQRIRVAPLPAGWASHIVIVNDASTDGTTAILSSAIDATVLHHDHNQGKGAALLTGFDAILSMQGDLPTRSDDVIIIQDADLEYDPADFMELLQPIVKGQTRVVYGTRFGPHNRAQNMVELIHERGNALLTALSNALTGYQLTDMESCYKFFRISVLTQVRPAITESRFGIEPQVTAALSKIGERIVEVPISYSPRSFDHGKKIKWTDGVRALWVIFREGLRRKLDDG